jgi:pimeloyl-ACP methyl ester carboxylesterase
MTPARSTALASEPEPRRIAAAGATLGVVHWPSPRTGGTPCLLIHGFDNHARIWDPLARQLQALAPSYAVDLRGHGDSDWADPITYHPLQLLDDLEVVTRALGLERFDLVGHSLGAWLAVQYAARHPGAVARLALVELPGLGDADGLAKLRADHARRPARFASVDDYRRYLAGIYLLGSDPAVRDLAEHGLYEKAGAYYPKTDPEYLRRSWDAEPPAGWARPWVRWSEDGLLRLVPDVTCPTLLVRGQFSALLKAQTAESLVGAWPRATLVTVPAAGHAVMVDNPRGCTRAIAAFLAGRAEGDPP